MNPPYSNRSNTTWSSIPWQPPPTFWIKLKCDGSIANDEMGIGGCLRDVFGTWIKGYSQFIGEGNALKVELSAILLDLKILSQLSNFSHLRVIIETDFLTAIDLLLNAPPNHHPLNSYLQLHVPSL